MMRRDRNRSSRGAILVGVVVVIAVVGAVAFLVSREATLQVHLGAAGSDEEAALQVAQAGLAHGFWYSQNVECLPTTPLANQPMGPHQYELSFQALPDDQIRITSTATLANGVQRSLQKKALVPSADAPSLVLESEADVYVHTDDHNDGIRLDLHAKRDLSGGKIENALLRFDLPPLTRWVVGDAGLKLTLLGWNHDEDPAPQSPSAIPFGVQTLAQHWVEGTGDDCPCDGAIWTSYDGDPAHPWSTPGGDFLPGVVDDQPLYAPGTYTWDVTALVEAWVDGSLPNRGLAIVGIPNKPDQAKFHSREAPVAAAERPRLAIQLACPCGSVCRTTYRDEFSQRTCTSGNADWVGSDGVLSVDWSPTPWVRSHPGADSCSGSIHIADLGSGEHALSIRGDGPTIERGADLSEHTQARLRFDYRRVAFGPSRFLEVEASPNGGATWHLLRRIFGSGTDTSPHVAQLDLSPYASADTRIRFRAVGLVGAAGPLVLVDDLQIDELPVAASPPPPIGLRPDRDSYLDAGSAGNNFGTDNDLKIRKPDDPQRAVFHFDVGAIPPGTLIQAATLRLWINKNDSSAPGANLIAYRILEEWSEFGVSWANRLLLTFWTQAGGTVAMPAVSQVLLAAGVEDEWVEFDLTPLVQAWVDGVLPNHGVRIDTDQNKEIKVTSREGNTDERPQLIVTFP